MKDIADIIDIPKVSEEDIEFACNRLESFMLVHRTRTGDERQKAIDTMISSLGLDLNTLTLIRKRLEKTCNRNWEQALLGVLVGLWIHENKGL